MRQKKDEGREEEGKKMEEKEGGWRRGIKREGGVGEEGGRGRRMEIY